MPLRDPKAVRSLVVIRRDQHQRLERQTRDGKTRSEVVRDALDRYFSIVPDVEIPPSGIYPVK
jgi:hypothetical protein